MIERTIDWCNENRSLVFIAVAALVFGGIWSLKLIPLDAFPDISDVQVIIHTEWMGQPPNIIEDQVTYPIVTAMLAAPHVKAVRAQTMFNDSYVFVVFEDGTDIYWARSRVLEYMQQLQGQLPTGVHPVIGPDATGAGWVYEYLLIDRSHNLNLADLRSLQDWQVRYALETVRGIVVMRYGQNALNVINGIKAKIAEIQKSLPPSVEIVAGYDRAGLIEASINTLKRDLLEEAIIVSLVIIVFLFHIRSALIPILTLPLAVLATFIPMYYFQVSSNIMSLGGLALAIGVLVDASIVMVENGYRHLSQRQHEADLEGQRVEGPERQRILMQAAKQVG